MKRKLWTTHAGTGWRNFQCGNSYKVSSSTIDYNSAFGRRRIANDGMANIAASTIITNISDLQRRRRLCKSGGIL